MDETETKQILEALVFVSGQSVSLKRIAEALPELNPGEVRRLIQALNDEYASSGRAFQIQEVAGGYQFVTDKQFAPWVKRFLEQPKPDLVSIQAMETLAIIAYRQPITKAEIEAIRGVDVTGSLDTLIERQFVRSAGRKESPGRPFLYATTPEFLRHFGLRSLEALPEMKLHVIKEPTAAELTAAEPIAEEPTAVSPSSQETIVEEKQSSEA